MFLIEVMADDVAGDQLTITVRVIRSFEYRNIKNIVLHHVSPNQKAQELLSFILEGMYLILKTARARQAFIMVLA